MGLTGEKKNLGNYSNAVASISGELSKKRKLEEQLNLPSAKHKFRLNPGNSQGESPLLDCCTDEDRDARRSFYCVKQFGKEGGVMDPAVMNGSTVLTLNRGILDTHLDVQPYETYSACSTGNSCISESSKHICCETSCSSNQSRGLPGNQSSCPPGNHSCSSAGYSNTFGVGLDHSQFSPHYLDCKATEKRKSDDSDCLCGSLEECIFEKENLYIHQSCLKNNQFNRLSSTNSAVQAKECHAVSFLGKDGTGTDSGESMVSGNKPLIVKRHKAIKTWEFGSGSMSDEHGGCPREQAQLTVLGDTHSSIETCSRPYSSACNPQNTTDQYGNSEAVITYTDIYDELDANREDYLERSTLYTDIMPETGETLPLFVLSSGRVTQNKGKIFLFLFGEHSYKVLQAEVLFGSTAVIVHHLVLVVVLKTLMVTMIFSSFADAHSRPPTIDKDFEQYFSTLML